MYVITFHLCFRIEKIPNRQSLKSIKMYEAETLKLKEKTVNFGAVENRLI